MFRFSFKIQHYNCAETKLSIDFPKIFITVFDIQSKNPQDKQYLYYIKDDYKKFDSIISYIKNSKHYKLVREVERSKEVLILIVMLHQIGYIQNIIQENNAFFIDLHTVHDGFEYWHVGVIDKSSIEKMRKALDKVGILKVLYINKVSFTQPLLTEQQKKVFLLASKLGYYEIPRKVTIEKIAKILKLNHSTVGEHLLKAENKIINSEINKV